MTLIFSNDNRLLFNVESSDQLLELGYNNRFNTSLDYKKSQKQASTSHKGGKRKFSVVDNNFTAILFHFIKRQDTASLALQSFSAIEILSLYGFLQNQDILTQNFLKNYFVCVQKFLEIFVVPDFASLHGLQVQLQVQRQEVVLQSETRIGTGQNHSTPQKEIEKQNKSLSENLYLQQNARRKIALLQDKASSAITKQSFVRTTMQGLAVTSLGGAVPVPMPFKHWHGLQITAPPRPFPFPLQGTTFGGGDRVAEQSFVRGQVCHLLRHGSALQSKPWLCKAKSASKEAWLCKAEPALLGKPWKKRIAAIFVSDYFAFLKHVWAFTNLQFVSARQTVIKQFLPKTRIWGFAFGSSFLLFSMASVLQRQEQNRWLLTLSRNQMPGLSLISQESSWECFENITLKYLNRKNFGYKYPNTKGFVKKIDCYKDIWYLSFSDSWNQQFAHNYTAIFSKRFEKAKLFDEPCTSGALYQMHARIPPKKVCAPLDLPCKPTSYAKHNCLQTKHGFVSKASRVNSYKERVNTENDSIPSKMAASTKFKNKDFICNRSSICKAHATDHSTFLNKSPICKPLMKGSPLVSPLVSGVPFVKARARARAWSKGLQIVDLFPCRGYLCSLQARFANKAGVQGQEKKQVKQNFARAHDRIKPLFYNFSSFSIETQALQPNSQDTDSVHDYSFSLDRRKSDLEKLLDSNRFSFLQEKTFFKPNTDLCTQNEKTKPGDTLPLPVPHGLQETALYQQRKALHSKEVRRSRSYQSYRGTLKVQNGQKGYKASLIKPKNLFSGICFFPYVQETSEVVPETKPPYKHKARLCKQIDTAQKDAKSEINCYTNLKPCLSKSTEKISSYFLYKRNSVSNRFMSGYQAPEIKHLQLKKERQKASPLYKPVNLRFVNKAIVSLQRLGQASLEFVSGGRAKPICLPRVFIKVPPALPFAESRINKSELDKAHFCLQNGSLRLYPPQVTPSPLVKGTLRITPVPYGLQIEDLLGDRVTNRSPKVSDLLASKTGVYKKRFSTEIEREGKPLLEENGDGVAKIQALKKIPYRQLSLNEEKEIKPLFEQVNNAFRISPYHFTFKRSLFTDYNDYLRWAKDTPAAISITPSLEEEDAIRDSWVAEQAFSKGLKSEALHTPLSDSSLSHSADETSAIKTAEQASLEARFAKQSQEDVPLLLDEQETNKKAKERKENPSAQEESLSTFEDEDKKREITKFEWLQQVREAEQLVEKRKDFQRLAYPNREALFSNRLQLTPGMIQSLLVSDRKDSFFGITNLFPKRLIAQDQKQINSQILQDEHDRRSISLLAQLSLRKNDTDAISSFALDSKNDVFIENLLKSKALYNLQKGSYDPHAFRARANTGTIAGLAVQDQTLALKKEKTGTTVASNTQSLQNHANQKLDMPSSKKEMFLSLRTVPRNREKSNSSICKGEGQKPVHPESTTFRARQHPIYAPNCRLRLRAPQLSLSSQSSNPQSRIDDLNLSQSHRWWQKRRLTSSLLGAPSKRYLVMPEITAQDWRKIIEWQLKTYLLEEEKRLAPLILQKADSTYRGITNLGNPSLNSVESNQTKHLFKIKKIALYLPWTTLKKSLKKPFEWPLTGLSYTSFAQESTPFSTPEIFTESESTLKTPLLDFLLRKTQNKTCSNPVMAPEVPRTLDQGNSCFAKPGHRVSRAQRYLFSEDLYPPRSEEDLLRRASQWRTRDSFVKNKKAELCFVSSISPNFKSSFFLSPPLTGKTALNGLHGDHLSVPVPVQNKVLLAKQDNQTSVYKPFLFEARTKSSYLVLHQLLLLVLIKQLFQSIYKLFGKVISHKIKNSSLATLLLPIFLNATSRRNQISEFSHLKKRLKDLVGSEDTVSSLSEIVWYLRNSCRGRMIPRGVVLVETHSSESTDYLKAIGGEAQVPVIVQSLRALPFTQNHPQRRLEKILTFAQKRAPCILFLDDLDSIGQSRTLLLKNSDGHLTPSRNGETSEKRKWKKGKNNVSCADPRSLVRTFGTRPLESRALYDSKAPFCAGGVREENLCSVFKTEVSITGVSSQNHGRNQQSHAWCKPFAVPVPVPVPKGHGHGHGQPKPNRFGTRKENRQNEVVHLSDTEKIVEQRRVDLMLRLLTVMDGITDFNGVLIVTTSKNPASLDPALLRPGRFEKLINLKLPNKKKRIELLKVETAKIGHTDSMPWGYLGMQTEDMTGTEISSAVNHSAFRAIIQSTVHTFPTLEYGISCVSNNGASAQSPQLQLRQMSRRAVSGSFRFTHTKGKAKVRANLFLKEIAVHNPYKSLQDFPAPEISQLAKQKSAGGQKLFTAFSESKTDLKKLREISLQISFHQAGKGVVRSSTFQAPKMSAFFENQGLQNKIPPNKSFCKQDCVTSARLQNGATPNAVSVAKRQKHGYGHDKQLKDKELEISPLGVANKTKLCTQNPGYKKDRARNERDQHNGTRTAFATNIVRLYAGQASESLYLDSIARFKNKAFSNPFSPLLFLQSTFSCKEKLNASSIIQNLVTSCPFYQKTDLDCPKGLVNPLQKTALYVSEAPSCRARVRGAKQEQVKTSKARWSFTSSLARKSSPPHAHAHAHALWARARARAYKLRICYAGAQTRTRATAITGTGAMTKAGLTHKDQVVTQRLVRKLQYLRCTGFFKKSFCIGYNSYTDLRKQFQLYRKTEPNGLALFYNRAGKDFWWEQKISETLKTFKRAAGNWYRLYLPKIEQNKNNREWLLPDAFSNQHISLLNQNVIMANRIPLHRFVAKRNLKASKASSNLLFSVHRNYNLSSHRKLYCSSNNLAEQGLASCPCPCPCPKGMGMGMGIPVTSATASANLLARRFVRQGTHFTSPLPLRAPVPVSKEYGRAQTESYTDFSYYSMVLNCFYVAFQNCSENRELLDLLADHLIRFKIVRLHEVVRINAFYF